MLRWTIQCSAQFQTEFLSVQVRSQLIDLPQNVLFAIKFICCLLPTGIYCLVATTSPLLYLFLCVKGKHSVKIAPDGDKKIALLPLRPNQPASTLIFEKKAQIWFHVKVWGYNGGVFCVLLHNLTNGENDAQAIHNFEANIYSKAVVWRVVHLGTKDHF